MPPKKGKEISMVSPDYQKKYCRYVLKQCGDPTRSVVVMFAQAIILLILGISSMFLVYVPVVHSR